jgi:isoleucyl-tRNA synthetase
MKEVSAAIAKLGQNEIVEIESKNFHNVQIGNETISLSLEDVEIVTEDIPGWLVASEGPITVALDINVTDDLKHEGIAREFVNRIQNIRKDSNFEVTNKITIQIQRNDLLNLAVEKHNEYIKSQTLGSSLELVNQLDTNDAREVDIDGIITYVLVKRSEH